MIAFKVLHSLLHILGVVHSLKGATQCLQSEYDEGADTGCPIKSHESFLMDLSQFSDRNSLAEEVARSSGAGIPKWQVML